MRLRGLSCIPFIVGCIAPALHAQGTCFRGPIRAECSGFVLLEATGAASVGDKERVATFPTSSVPIRFQDLPGYYSGALGYARVIDSNTAIGGVGELGLGMSDMGDPARIALKGRWRRQLPNWTLDVGAGALAVQVYNGKRVCCVNDAMAYGGTAETALLYKGYGGLTASADLVHGAGRTSSAAHVGARVGSYGSVTIGTLVVIGTAIVVIAFAGALR